VIDLFSSADLVCMCMCVCVYALSLSLSLSLLISLLISLWLSFADRVENAATGLVGISC
jgi:hypothetical protein